MLAVLNNDVINVILDYVGPWKFSTNCVCSSLTREPNEPFETTQTLIIYDAPAIYDKMTLENTLTDSRVLTTSLTYDRPWILSELNYESATIELIPHIIKERKWDLIPKHASYITPSLYYISVTIYIKERKVRITVYDNTSDLYTTSIYPYSKDEWDKPHEYFKSLFGYYGCYTSV